MNEKTYWLGLHLVPSIGPSRFRQLLEAFGDARSAWQAPPERLRAAGLPAKSVAELLKARQSVNLEALLTRLRAMQAEIVITREAHYPTLLNDLPDAPPLLYVKGTLDPAADQRAVAIVGTRKATHAGRKATYDIARALAESGVTIVSGLAQGIDAAAHQGALDGGGRTLAVLGNGIDIVYPKENAALAERIRYQGALLTTYPPGTPPRGHHFPQRNRLISGLALGVLIGEAPHNSGALITAESALDQSREVFALPATVSNAQGTGNNRLLQEGAAFVTGAEDILNALDLEIERRQTRQHVTQVQPSNDTEHHLLQHLSADPIHVDDIIRLTALPSEVVISHLTILELKGLAQSVGGMHYCRAMG